MWLRMRVNSGGFELGGGGSGGCAASGGGGASAGGAASGADPATLSGTCPGWPASSTEPSGAWTIGGLGWAGSTGATSGGGATCTGGGAAGGAATWATTGGAAGLAVGWWAEGVGWPVFDVSFKPATSETDTTNAKTPTTSMVTAVVYASGQDRWRTRWPVSDRL